MTLSHVLISDAIKKPAGRFSIRPSLRTSLLFGIPVVVVGVAGLSYYLYKSRRSATSAEDSLPKTPLEAAVALKNRGNKYFKAGQYEKAIELYTEGLDHCPLDAVTERSALYQNRAAAKGSLRQYESAVVDCTSALELSPRYMKALNRRAHLYEKLEQWEDSLLDVVACCIFEEFKNPDNIICMDQTLKKVGQKKAREEWDKVSHTLPSAAFIRNYLSAFAWDPFTKTTIAEAEKSHNDHPNGTEHTETAKQEDQAASEGKSEAQGEPWHVHLVEANQTLNKAIDLLNQGDYEKSMTSAESAVALFEKVLSEDTTDRTASAPVEVVNLTPTPDGDEADTADRQVKPNGRPTTGAESNPETTVAHSKLTEEQRKRARAAYNRALLLRTTYWALCGRAVEAKQQFQKIFAEGSGADVNVRVNALIKSACLSMSVDQDFAACLYDFQTAQNACPECPDVYLHRGQINLLADQLDEAMHDLNTAVKLKPEFSIAQAQRLYTQYRKALADSNGDRILSRLDEFRRLAQKYPTCLETHSLFAQVLTERGDFNSSDEEFARVIELAPKSGLAYAHRGLLQLRWKQDRDAALKWFTLGAKADPKCELIQELLGQLAVEQGEFMEALKHFDLAIREAKTQNDLAHLISLREGVRAQYDVCQKYGIAVSEVVSSLKREQQQMMMGMV